jgi:hypothetical protein
MKKIDVTQQFLEALKLYATFKWKMVKNEPTKNHMLHCCVGPNNQISSLQESIECLNEFYPTQTVLIKSCWHQDYAETNQNKPNCCFDIRLILEMSIEE